MLRSVTASFTTVSTDLTLPALDLNACRQPLGRKKRIPTLHSTSPHFFPSSQRNATQSNATQIRHPAKSGFFCVTSHGSPSCHYHAVHASHLAPTPSLFDFVIIEDGTVPQQAPSHIYPAQRLLRQAIRPTGLHTLARLGSLGPIPVHATTSSPVLLA